MKFQSFSRTLTIAIGFGAALLFANSAPAQEIANTQFDDGPFMAYAQPAPASDLSPVVAAQGTENSQFVDGPVVAEFPQPIAPLVPRVLSSAATIVTPNVAQEAALSMRTSTEDWMISALFVCIAWIALYALSEAKRANRNLEARTGTGINNPAALS
ncbi:MAG: hypothetical protein WBL63_22820 [Candidatus Acidiferrum sp.]